MKTKFRIRQICNNEMANESEVKECIINDGYEESGFIFDGEEGVYKIYPKEYIFNEGDRIGLDVGWFLIKWKAVDIDENIIIYEIEQE